MPWKLIQPLATMEKYIQKICIIQFIFNRSKTKKCEVSLKFLKVSTFCMQLCFSHPRFGWLLKEKVKVQIKKNVFINIESGNMMYWHFVIQMLNIFKIMNCTTSFMQINFRSRLASSQIRSASQNLKCLYNLWKMEHNILAFCYAAWLGANLVVL